MNSLRYLIVGRFWQQVIQNFLRQDGLDAVVVLAYTTLIGLVPLVAVLMSVFSLSEWFGEARDHLLNQALPYLLPESAEQIENYLLQFSLQAAQLPVVSIAFMLVSVLFLMSTVDEKINQMWHKRMRRIWWHSLLHYLGITLLGPVLLAMSVLLSSSLLAVPLLDQFLHLPWLTAPLLGYLPSLLAVLGFVALYRWVPIRSVSWSAAWVGAVIVVMVLGGLKAGFKYYVEWFPTYNLIYGAFAVVPLFLLWLYSIWMVVIFGASLVRQLSLENPLKDPRAQSTASTVSVQDSCHG